MRFYCTHFNFYQDHMGLTKKENRSLEKNIPAKERKKNKIKWMLRELLN